MLTAVLSACEGADAVVMAAAVADYAPAHPAADKVKKGAADEFNVELTKTVDILAATPRGLIRIGFAAESTNLIQYAQAKLDGKALDFIVANDITVPNSGFGADNNKVSIVSHQGVEDLPMMSKYGVATEILNRVAQRLAGAR
jgi:phosphopantothenoylcysteine decarboxylase/phosphopantothenate--cysteine ligase